MRVFHLPVLKVSPGNLRKIGWVTIQTKKLFFISQASFWPLKPKLRASLPHWPEFPGIIRAMLLRILFFFMVEKTFNHNIYLIGMMGSGKSYWANRLGHCLGLPGYDLDVLIEIKQNDRIAIIFEKQGEDYFRKLESETLKTGVPAKNFVLATGGGTPCFFDNLAFMKNNGLVIWLNPPLEELLNRLAHGQRDRPMIAQASAEGRLHDHVRDLLQKRTGFYSQAHLVVTAAKPDLHALENAIRQWAAAQSADNHSSIK